MPERERIVAVGLLTESDLRTLGREFRRVYPIDETPCFAELLRAIDEADREFWRERDGRSTEALASDSRRRRPSAPRSSKEDTQPNLSRARSR